MKKIAICILIAAMFALQLSGCGVDKKEAPNTPATVETGDASNTDQQAGALEVSTDSNPTGKDNSQDVYSMAINTPLQVEHPANAINGGEEKSFWENPGLIILKSIFLKTWRNAGTSFLL